VKYKSKCNLNCCRDTTMWKSLFRRSTNWTNSEPKWHDKCEIFLVLDSVIGPLC